MNLSKTKYLHIGEEMKDPDLGNNQTITIRDNYKYWSVRIGKGGWHEKNTRKNRTRAEGNKTIESNKVAQGNIQEEEV
jgi:hypothetical protein